ncbi:hypothetical protein EDB85DRAFT_1886254 [Lactarius pseudohatsudake]|nr:hypothetical protein EDB85DRAFT_1886254 [Lactarius pseudohatsudake]
MPLQTTNRARFGAGVSFERVVGLLMKWAFRVSVSFLETKLANVRSCSSEEWVTLFWEIVVVSGYHEHHPAVAWHFASKGRSGNEASVPCSVPHPTAGSSGNVFDEVPHGMVPRFIRRLGPDNDGCARSPPSPPEITGRNMAARRQSGVHTVWIKAPSGRMGLEHPETTTVYNSPTPPPPGRCSDARCCLQGPSAHTQVEQKSRDFATISNQNREQLFRGSESQSMHASGMPTAGIAGLTIHTESGAEKGKVPKLPRDGVPWGAAAPIILPYPSPIAYSNVDHIPQPVLHSTA